MGTAYLVILRDRRLRALAAAAAQFDQAPQAQAQQAAAQALFLEMGQRQLLIRVAAVGAAAPEIVLAVTVVPAL